VGSGNASACESHGAAVIRTLEWFRAPVSRKPGRQLHQQGLGLGLRETRLGCRTRLPGLSGLETNPGLETTPNLGVLRLSLSLTVCVVCWVFTCSVKRSASATGPSPCDSARLRTQDLKVVSSPRISIGPAGTGSRINRDYAMRVSLGPQLG